MLISNGGLEVRYAKVSTGGVGGRNTYRLTQSERKYDKEYTYVFEGRRSITSEGKELHVKKPQTHVEDLKNNQELA